MRNEYLRGLARHIVDREYGGNETHAAAAKPSLSRTMLHEFLNGSRGAGDRVIDWLAEHTGRTGDDLRGRSLKTSDPYPNRAVVLAALGDEFDYSAVKIVREAVLPPGKPDEKMYWVQTLQFVQFNIERPEVKQILSLVNTAENKDNKTE